MDVKLFFEWVILLIYGFVFVVGMDFYVVEYKVIFVCGCVFVDF